MKNIKEQCFVLDKKSTFYDAIKKLDQNGDGVLPIIDKKGYFIGLITDGDVRRAVLENKSELEKIINKNPYKLGIESSTEERIIFLKKYRIRHLPIIDKDNKLIDIFVSDSLKFKVMKNPVIIMAGGMGTRLGELTKDIPKPMLHVGGRPILETILLSLIEYGFHKFYISVNYKKEIIMDYFEDGSKWNVKIEYLTEDKKLGTAGALSLVTKDHKNPILVTNGDVITNLDYHKFIEHHNEQGSKATMAVREYEYIVPYGVVEVDGFKISQISEKPTKHFNINAGVYIIDPDILADIPKNTFYDMTTLFEDLGKKKLSRSVFFLQDYWIDVGQVKELTQADADVRLMSRESND